MARPLAGFTLLELLIALLVITGGLLGFVGALGPLAELQGKGRRFGRAAILIDSRLDQLRFELQAGGCSGSPAGSAMGGPGLRETWSSSTDSIVAELRVVLERRTSRGWVADTVVTRAPCP